MSCSGQIASLGGMFSHTPKFCSSIPSESTYLDFGFDPQSVHVQEATDQHF